jgi:hypothetical protein
MWDIGIIIHYYPLDDIIPTTKNPIEILLVNYTVHLMRFNSFGSLIFLGCYSIQNLKLMKYLITIYFQ